MNTPPAKESALNLTGKQRRFLRSLAHELKPVVQVGHAGLTESVVNEIDSALESHELIKVKVGRECPEERDPLAKLVESRASCAVVQIIGNTLVAYRPHPKQPSLQLPGDRADQPQKKAKAKKASSNKAGSKKASSKKPSSKKPSSKKPSSKKPSAKRAGAKRLSSKRPGSSRPASSRQGSKQTRRRS